MTYSIVARDSETSQLGVAVQSHYFSVGPIVPWALAAVGAVATQSFVDPAYGPLGLELMSKGKTAPEALRGLVASDPQEDRRQVALVDAAGLVASHTGARCIAAAGHRTGDGYSCQANMMLRDTVWDAMAAAYESAPGDLAHRLLAALDSAESEGGDIRGRQSAAILVVTGEPSGKAWDDRLFDLRVEDSDDPLGELRRLVGLRREYARASSASRRFQEGEVSEALRELADARPEPAGDELDFWYALQLAGAGRVEESLPVFRAVFEREPRFAELLRRLPAAGLFPDDSALIVRLTGGPGGGAGGARQSTA